jgi:hypothetical protein
MKNAKPNLRYRRMKLVVPEQFKELHSTAIESYREPVNIELLMSQENRRATRKACVNRGSEFASAWRDDGEEPEGIIRATKGTKVTTRRERNGNVILVEE